MTWAVGPRSASRILGLIAYHARMGAVSPRIANPDVTGAPRPVEFLFGWASDRWLAASRVGNGRHDGRARRRVRARVASAARPPVRADGDRLDGDRLAGPDHELGAVRRVQPAALALARGLALGEAVADGGALHRHRLRDLLLRPVLPGHGGSCAGFRRARRSMRSSGATRCQPGGCSSSSSGSSSTRSSRSSSFARACTSTRKSFRGARCSPERPSSSR